MPRKTTKKATLQVEATHSAEWRYFLRNPDFQKDMRGLNCLLRSKQVSDRITKFIEERERVANKWRLLMIPGEAIIYWPGENPSAEEIKCVEQYGQFPLLSYSPVTSTELRDDRFLFLRVDLEQPADVLVPLFEEELRQQTEKRLRRRRRPDKVDFYLEVFDRAKDGATFAEIASKLNRKPSTVKSAYLRAVNKIFGPAPVPKKALLPLDYFDPSTHIASCATCQNAKTAEEMCREIRLHVRQDHVAQREITGHDTTR